MLICLEDIKETESALYKSFKEMLDLEEHAIDDDLTFDIEILKGKKLSLKELCEDSSSTNVTMENVTQYVDLYLKHRFLNTISKKHLFAKGFSDMLLGSALHTSFFQVLYKI